MKLPNTPETPSPQPTTIPSAHTNDKVRTRHWLRVLGVVFVVLLVASIVAAVWLPRLVDVKIVLDTATKAVEESTGRTLTVKGPASVRLWPRLAVVAENVSFGNASWAKDAEMATAQRVSLSLDWLPLLHKSVSINRAELDGLQLNLQQGAPGAPAGNWVLAGSDSRSSSAFQLDKILLQNANVQLRDASGAVQNTFVIGRMAGVFTGAGIKFKGQDAFIQAPDTSGGVTTLLAINQASGLVSTSRAEFAGQVVWRQQPIELKGQYDYPDNNPNSLTLSVNTRALDLSKPVAAMPGTPSVASKTNGVVKPAAQAPEASSQPWWQDSRPIDWSFLPRMNLSLDLNAGQVLLPNQTLLPNVVLRGSINESGTGQLTLNEFSAGFDKGHISASGALTDFLGKSPALKLEAKASGFDLAKVYALKGVKVPNVAVKGAPVDLDVSLSAQGLSPRQLMDSSSGYVVAKLGAGSMVDPGDATHRPLAVTLKSFSGRADLVPGRAPQLNVDLLASKIDLSSPGKPTPPDAGNASHQGDASTKSFWTESLGFESLPVMNGRIHLDVTDMVLPSGQRLPNFLLNASMQDAGGGMIRVDQFSAGFEQGQIKASGSLANYAGQGSNPALTLQAKAGGFDLPNVLASQKINLPGVSVKGMLVQLDVSVSARGRTPRQLLSTMDGSVQGSVGSGSYVDQGGPDRSRIGIDLQSFNGRADLKRGVSPRLALDLNATKIDLDPHLPIQPVTEVKSKAKGKAVKDPRRWLFGTQSLGLDNIPLMNGRIGLNVSELVLPNGITLPGFLLKASLLDSSGGTMRVDQLRTGFGEGVLMADGTISQYTTANPSIRLRGHARDFSLEKLINQMDAAKAFGQVKGGQGEFAFHLEGQGSSLRSLVSNLNGEVQVSVNSATLPTSMVSSAGDFFVSIVNTINPLYAKSATSQLQCVSAYLPIRNGLLPINNTIGIQTDQLNVLLNGQVDLKQEQMNINIQSAQRSGLTTGVNPAGWIVIEGTFLHPTWGINKTGVVKQAASVGLAVVTSGLSLAAQNLLSVATNSNPCQNVLKPWSTIDGQLMSKAAQ